MAAKNDDHIKYKGLRGVWTRFTEPHSDTGNSYASIAKQTAGIGAILTGGYTLGVAGLGALAISAFNYDDFNIYEDTRLYDDSFEEMNHIAVKTDEHDIVLVQDENAWRVYTASDAGRYGGKLLTYVPDEEEAREILESVHDRLDREHQWASDGGVIFEHANIYDLHITYGVYHDEDMSFRAARYTTENGYDGQSIEYYYGDTLNMMNAALQDMDTSDDVVKYGFLQDDTPVMEIDEHPLFKSDDGLGVALEMSKIMLMLTGPAIPLFFLIGWSGEAAHRRKLKHGSKKAPQIKDADKEIVVDESGGAHEEASAEALPVIVKPQTPKGP